MSSKIRYIDFSPDEYIAGVSGKLNPEQAGVYWTVCSLIYSKSGPIDNDPIWLGNILGGTHWRTVKRIINDLISMGKIDARDGQLWVQRCSIELAKTEHRISTARANGEQGGRPSKENNDIEEPDGSDEEKLTTNQQLPTTNQQPVDRAKTGKTLIPEDWTPDEKCHEKAKAEGYTEDETNWLSGGFVDHFRESGIKRENWNLSFYKWLKSDITIRAITARRRLNNNGANAQGGRGQPASIATAVGRFVAARSD